VRVGEGVRAEAASQTGPLAPTKTRGHLKVVAATSGRKKQDPRDKPGLHVKQRDLVEICAGPSSFPAGDYGAGRQLPVK